MAQTLSGLRVPHAVTDYARDPIASATSPRSERAARTSLLLALSIGLACFGLACDSGGDSSVAPTDASTSTGLDITLPSIDGDDVSLAASTESDVFVLTFWATWCEPCQAELAKFQPIWRELSPRGMQLIAIATDGPDSAAGVPTIARREGYEFPVLLDRDSEVFARYNPSGDLPFYVVLDAKGTVLKSHQGYNPGDEDELRHFLEQKLPPAAE